MPTRQRIKLETSPHVIELEGLPGMPEVLELQFQPEVLSDAYLEAFGTYQAGIEATGLDQDTDDDAQQALPRREQVEALEVATREFLAGFMLEHSSDVFLERVPLDPPAKPAKATKATRATKAAKAVKSGKAGEATTQALAEDGQLLGPYKLQLPQWVLARMVTQVTEFYGDRPTGSSTASAPPSSRAGRRSTAASRSRGSNRGRGR